MLRSTYVIYVCQIIRISIFGHPHLTKVPGKVPSFFTYRQSCCQRVRVALPVLPSDSFGKPFIAFHVSRSTMTVSSSHRLPVHTILADGQQRAPGRLLSPPKLLEERQSLRVSPLRAAIEIDDAFTVSAIGNTHNTLENESASHNVRRTT